MTARNFFWKFLKGSITLSLIDVTVADRYFEIFTPDEITVSPTLNSPPKNVEIGELNLAEKFCLQTYKFSRGDVVVCRGLLNPEKKYVQRILTLPEESFQGPRIGKLERVPKGYCEMEGGTESTKFLFMVPLGLIEGRVIWPENKISKVERSIPEKDLPS